MEGFDGEKMGQAVGIVSALLIGFWSIVRGFKKSDATPPAERAPNIHEIRQALSEFRGMVEEARDDAKDLAKDQYNEVKRQLDRIEIMLHTRRDQ
ncbi:hypothetical protein ACHFJ0_05140 [Paracoccus sp. NGMCC 1.201697]|uniref:Uncharacterized protein n=1 Tax=Paracoccus broussonetiae subsp. drimophilus TaxID=3373869 RepID=A0ABW7LH09_9RHOB